MGASCYHDRLWRHRDDGVPVAPGYPCLGLASQISPRPKKRSARRPARRTRSARSQAAPKVAQAYTPRVISTIATKPVACAASVTGLGSNWAPKTATRAGPANANVTLAQAERCDLITKRVPKPRLGDDQSTRWCHAYRHAYYPSPVVAIGTLRTICSSRLRSAIRGTCPQHVTSASVRSRRILPVPARFGGGRLTERTPAVQPRRREGVKVPLKRPCRRAREPAKLLESGHSTFPAVDHILARSWRDAAIAFLLTEKSHRGYTHLRTMSANTRRRAAPNIGGRHGYRCCPLAARTRA